MSRRVNLTRRAPDIVAAILVERLAPGVAQFELAAGTPLLREEQQRKFEKHRCAALESPVDFCEKGVYSFLTP